jgi:N-acetylmuramoyl-L-alanine amidase
MKIYLTAGHDVRPNGTGTGAFGINHPGHEGKRVDEAVEAVWLRDAITTHLRKHRLDVVNDKNDTPLAAALTWLRQLATSGDWCIEIHFNAGAGSATGCECVVTNDHTPQERDMARAICRAINTASGIRIRNRQPDRGGVIFESETARGRIGFLHSPAVAHNILIEVAFVTSQHDMDKYFANRSKIAVAIAEHIIKWI